MSSADRGALRGAALRFLPSGRRSIAMSICFANSAEVRKCFQANLLALGLCAVACRRKARARFRPVQIDVLGLPVGSAQLLFLGRHTTPQGLSPWRAISLARPWLSRNIRWNIFEARSHPVTFRGKEVVARTRRLSKASCAIWTPAVRAQNTYTTGGRRGR